ncbi:metal-dependent hydrolase [Alkanindiges sp. WGS2144]|uniref:metal-dependent hydrolase n=1 Tax=Alkanindiges sp. WGS2144 TaxID=3366808 RepID=UPI003752AF26
MNAKVAPHTAKNSAIKASFPVRRMDFEFAQVPEYWMSNSPGLTHFMTALSALFPAGEQFFVDSVRAVRYHPLLKDDLAIQKEISAFIGQEAMHSKEHVGFNQSANAYGHDVNLLENKTDRLIQSVRKVFARVTKPLGITQEMIDLTATTALEHFTATIASQLLGNSEIQSKMSNETMYRLWMWHAVEENEHKAVVYDVFEALYGKGIKAYGLRNSAMVIAMVLLFLTQTYFVVRLLRQDKQLNMAALRDIYKYGYSPKHGIISGMVPELLAYFRPGFHPNDHDTNALLAHWKENLGFVMH